MKLSIYDPKPSKHQYLTDMFLAPMREHAWKNGVSVEDITTLTARSNVIVLTLADNLNLDTVNQLKNNNCKIVGFSINDESRVSVHCREAAVLSKIDLMFMLAGIQKVNTGHEFIVDKDFNIKLEERQFLPEEDWTAFNMMRLSGRLKSLPYVHWQRQAHVEARPYSLRSQKVLIRGGSHMRRFILAVQLMKHNLLDCNSAFMKAPYFQDDMTPRFRYCEDCRNEWRKSGRYPYVPNKKASELCTNDCRHNLNDPNGWNNKCTQTFYEAAEKFGADMGQVETLLHGNWLSQEQHLAMLARITFTSDLKWIFSIYAAQRFWDAAMVGCINVLPSRTMDQDYFPVMEPNVHYRVFGEDMASLRTDVAIDEAEYNSISKSAMALYNQWMRPSDYSINTNLLQKIFQDIKAIQ